MTYPLVPETVVEFAASVDELVVIEEKRPFVETQLRSILHEAGSPVPVLGKRDRAGRPLVSSVGELDADRGGGDPHAGRCPSLAAGTRGAGRRRQGRICRCSTLPGPTARVLQRLSAQPLDRRSRTARWSAAASAATGSCTSRPATRA